MASEKFCLNWNDFQKNIRSTFQEMRDDLDLADVTLACEDRRQFQAHKFVLSASSPFFKEILGNNRHPHPLIYLKGMKAVALESVLDFLYRGEVNVYQQDLNDFLALAEDLQLKGLTGQQTKEDENIKEMCFTEEEQTPRVKVKPRELLIPKEEIYIEQVQDQADLVNTNIIETSILAVAVQETIVNVNNDELNATIENLLEKVGNIYNCKMCGQQSGHKATLKRHIESMHTTGGSHPCKVCGKIFRSSNPLNLHMSRKHNKEK